MLRVGGGASLPARLGWATQRCVSSFSFGHRASDEAVKVEETADTKDLGKGRMFAVVRVQGKQYRVTPGDVIMCDSLASVNVGDKYKFDEVLLLGAADLSVVGAPVVANAHVEATVEEHTRTEKIHVFKKKRRKGYKKRIGHRSDVTVLRIQTVQLHD